LKKLIPSDETDAKAKSDAKQAQAAYIQNLNATKAEIDRAKGLPAKPMP
jgi:hypothetical protein